MSYTEKISYQYWTGIQWEERNIEIAPVMETGWHIFNVIASLIVWPWVLVYAMIYISRLKDHKHEVEVANASIAEYYGRLEQARNQALLKAGLIEND